jgi:hypothetical protein
MVAGGDSSWDIHWGTRIGNLNLADPSSHAVLFPSVVPSRSHAGSMSAGHIMIQVVVVVVMCAFVDCLRFWVWIVVGTWMATLRWSCTASRSPADWLHRLIDFWVIEWWYFSYKVDISDEEREDDSEWFVDKDMKEGSRILRRGAIRELFGKLRKTSVRIDGNSAEVWTGCLPNTSLQGYSYTILLDTL